MQSVSSLQTSVFSKPKDTTHHHATVKRLKRQRSFTRHITAAATELRLTTPSCCAEHSLTLCLPSTPLSLRQCDCQGDCLACALLPPPNLQMQGQQQRFNTLVCLLECEGHFASGLPWDLCQQATQLHYGLLPEGVALSRRAESLDTVPGEQQSGGELLYSAAMERYQQDAEGRMMGLWSNVIPNISHSCWALRRMEIPWVWRTGRGRRGARGKGAC
ncbi:hypothetical protein UPYG_G00248660 [Umbra pygmaea]|uniref:Uncharacterized protein n=1 Tax=Umbra pygmaea TaxID=75934 RepID=A0ABD0WX01_UMBPY